MTIDRAGLADFLRRRPAAPQPEDVGLVREGSPACRSTLTQTSLPAAARLPSFGAQLAQETAVVGAYPLLDEASPVVEAEYVDQVEHDAFTVGRQRASR